jgi:hypothetical protein
MMAGKPDQPDKPTKCPPNYRWNGQLGECVPVIVTPKPPPPPPPTRLGNPSVSVEIFFKYALPGTQPDAFLDVVSPKALEPFPPIPGGEATILTLTGDKANYVYGQDTTILTAQLKFASDGAPLASRYVVFAVAGASYLIKTDATGTAVLAWRPFGVPNPGDPVTSETYFAQCAFFGY